MKNCRNKPYPNRNIGYTSLAMIIFYMLINFINIVYSIKIYTHTHIYVHILLH